MNNVSAIVLALIISPIGINALTAHPGNEQHGSTREWSDANGLFEFEASFVLAQEDRVQLRRCDGEVVWLPLTSLSPGDRDWIRNRVESQAVHVPVDRPAEMAETPTPASLATRRTSAVPFAAFMGCAGAMLTALIFVVRCKALGLSFVLVAAATAGPLTLWAMAPAPEEKKSISATQRCFEPFKAKLELRADDDFLYVGSNGLPEHQMMVGITAWQQQVPLPQPYTGKNAWSIPLKPRLADKPISAKNALFRGAIALAVNGVPIFNALNNRGEDAYLAGELDQFGGHCGRGDDYHYHIAPVHLEKVVGKGNPIAFALDGFPLYGFTDAAGNEPKDLDQFNGRMEKDGYRYYSTRKYPYINGGMRGVVVVRGDQIEPQPRDAPVRPAGRPLRGASITDFTRDDDLHQYTLKYDLQGKSHAVKYTINNDGTFTFRYTDGAGKETTETLRRREPKEGKGKKDKKEGPGKKDEPAPGKDGPAAGKPCGAPLFAVHPGEEPGGRYAVELVDNSAAARPVASKKGCDQCECHADAWRNESFGRLRSSCLSSARRADSAVSDNEEGVRIADPGEHPRDRRRQFEQRTVVHAGHLSID